MRTRAFGLARGRCSSASASSAGKRRASAKYGMRPSARHPVACAICSMPAANSAGSPRNLLTMKPRISAASSGASTALVPTRLAITPPRSMSPISTTGTSAARANPILAMSFAAQIDFRHAAGALDEDDIGLAAQPLIAVEHVRQEIALHVLIGGRLGAAKDAPLHHDLGADLALRFQQHRIHVHAWRHAGGARLQGLRAPDFAAVRRHRRIVRHVLRLERPHGEAALGEGAGEPGDDQRFADVRAGAGKHERARRHVFRTRCPAAPSRRRRSDA